ncbi:MAG: guanylate kinase [Gammaproteobacteria bacterium]|nr:MAG: guanylate kinase [Gammaproteobacteria bacterium]
MTATGNLYIVSAPSGAGKTSLLKALTSKDEGIATAISTTTRTKRLGEVDGTDYHFVTPDEFQNLIELDDFLEHAEVFGNLYGTSKIRLNEALKNGLDLILEIDWQGAQQIRQQLPSTTSIFILPPSRDELANRLKGRGQDDDSVIQKRMSAAIEEISHFNEYDYLVINDDFDQALNELEHIILAQRLTQTRQAELNQQLIQDLL